MSKSNSWFGSSKARKCKPKKHARKLFLEGLEDRRLMAWNVTNVGDDYTITEVGDVTDDLTVTFDGTNTYTLSTTTSINQATIVSPASITIVGGAGDDTITIGDGVTIITSINGGGQGTNGDTLVLQSSSQSVTVNGGTLGSGAGSAFGVSAFSDIESIDVTAGASFFDIVSVASLGSISNITTGASDDTVSVDGEITGKLDTGAGDDSVIVDTFGNIFDLDMGTDVALGDKLTVLGGQTFNVTADYQGTVVGRVTSFKNVEDLQGQSVSTDTFVVSSGKKIDSVNGGGDNDTLTVLSSTGDALTWAVTSASNGTVTRGLDVLSFANITNLVGGDGNDVFNINYSLLNNPTDLVPVTPYGSVTTGNGTNSVTVALAAIVNLITGGTDDDTIDVQLGGTSGNIIAGDGANGITVAGTSGTVTGGTGIDTVLISGNSQTVSTGAASDSITISGTVNGDVDSGAGTDTITLSGGTSSITGNLLAGALDSDILKSLRGLDALIFVNSLSGGGAAAGIGGTFDGVDNIETDGSSDQITVQVGGALTGYIQGGAGDNIVSVQGSVGGNITTLGGKDSITVSGSGSAGNINAGNGGTAGSEQTVTIANTATVGTITTGTGDDIIQVLNTASSGAIIAGNGTNSVTVGGTSGSITAGNGADTVTVTGTSGTISVGDGGSTVSVSGTSGSITATNGFDTVTVSGTTSGGAISVGDGGSLITVGGSSGSISAANGIDSVTVTGTSGTISVGDGGSSITVSGSSGNISANVGVDTVSVSGTSGTITTGDGNDLISVTGAVGDVDAGTGTDKLTVNTGSDALFVINNTSQGTFTDTNLTNFTGVENLVGGTANDTFTIDGTGTVETIDGAGEASPAGDKLVYINQASGVLVSITGPNSGTASGLTGIAPTFTSIESITTSTLADTVTVGSGGSLTGVLDGGNPTTSPGDVLDLTALTTPSPSISIPTPGNTNGTVTTTGTVLAAFGNFETINAINASYTFTGAIGLYINGAGSGYTFDPTAYTALPFSAIPTAITNFTGAANLTITGATNDVVWVDVDGTNVGSISGNIDTGGGNDLVQVESTVSGTISLGAGDDQILLLGPTASTGAINGGANGENNTLISDRGSNASFVVTGLNTGTATGTGGFSFIQNLTGGTAADTFELAAGSLDGAIHGAGTATPTTRDTLTYANRTLGVTVTVNAANAGTATDVLGGFTSIENITTSDDVDIVSIQNFLYGDVSAKAGNDQITIGTTTAAVVNGIVLGGNGDDILTVDRNVDANFLVDNANAGSVNGINDAVAPSAGGDFFEIETIKGGVASDTFTITSQLSGSLGFGDVFGEGGHDKITISGTGNIGGSVRGGNDNDTLTLTSTATNVVGVWFNGDAGDDTLVSNRGTDAQFVVNGGTNVGTAAGILGLGGPTGFDFNAENLVGGTAIDTITVGNGTSTNKLTGFIAGMGGNDIITVMNLGEVGSTPSVGTPSEGIIFGGAGDDTITIQAGGKAKAIDTGDLAPLSPTTSLPFTSIDSATDSNTVIVNGLVTGNVAGSIGIDDVKVTGTVGGNVATNFGNDIVEVSGTSGLVSGNIVTSDGEDQIKILAGATLTGLVNAGNDNDTLTVDKGVNADFRLNNPGNGTFEDGNATVYQGVENLLGGTADDTFTVLNFSSGNQVSINGAGGNNTLTYDDPGRTTGATVTVTGPNSGNSSNVAAFSNIQNVKTTNLVDTVTIDNGGSLSGNVETLGDVDTFTMNGASSVTGNVDLGLGNDIADLNGTAAIGGILNGNSPTTPPGDTLDIAGMSPAAWLNLTTPATGSGNVTQGSNVINFTSFETFIAPNVAIASPAVIEVSAPGVVNAYSSGSAATGVVSGLLATFTGVVNVQTIDGTSNDDHAIVRNGGTLDGSIDLNDGTDNLRVEKTGGATFNVNAPNANAGTATGLGLTIMTDSFLDTENLYGSAESDTFNVNGGGTLDGLIDAGDGNNTIALLGTVKGTITAGTGDDTVSVAGTAGVSANATAFVEIATGAGKDSITVSGTVYGTIDAGDGGTTATPQTVSVGGGGLVTGNVLTGTDVDTVSNSGMIKGKVESGSGNDTVNNSGTIESGVFTGAGDDTINMTGGAIGTPSNTTTIIDTATGEDKVFIASGAVHGQVLTGDDKDLLEVGSASTNAVVNGSIDLGNGGTGAFGNAALNQKATVFANSVVNGTITSGSGVDDILINGQVGSSPTFNGVAVGTGAGNDRVQVGPNSGSNGQVFGSINTGLGADTVNSAGKITFGIDTRNGSSETDDGAVDTVSITAGVVGVGLNTSDIIQTGAGADTVTVNGITDIHGNIDTQASNSTLVDGNDTVTLGTNPSTSVITNVRGNVVTGFGNDVVTVCSNANVLTNPSGAGKVLLGDGTDTGVIFNTVAGGVYGGNGADQIRAGSTTSGFVNVAMTFYGEAGNDVITGGHGDDVLDGGADVDQIQGNNGHDRIFGGSHGDLLRGNAGNDIIFGEDGADQLIGDAGNDILVGGAHNDSLGDAGGGYNVLLGGGGVDTLTVGGTTPTTSGSVMIGERTVYDSIVRTGGNYDATASAGVINNLNAILAIWQDTTTNPTIDARRNKLLSDDAGSSTPTNDGLLGNLKVSDDGLADRLALSAAAADLYWQKLGGNTIVSGATSNSRRIQTWTPMP